MLVGITCLRDTSKQHIEYDRTDISEGIDVSKGLVHQNNVIFVTIAILKILVLSANHIFAMAVMI